MKEEPPSIYGGECQKRNTPNDVKGNCYVYTGVNAVDPGATDCGWMTEEIRRELLPRFPMGRIGQPEDVARLITFLASDEAAWITGQVIHSRGGFQ